MERLASSRSVDSRLRRAGSLVGNHSQVIGLTLSCSSIVKNKIVILPVTAGAARPEAASLRSPTARFATRPPAALFSINDITYSDLALGTQ